MTCAADVMSRNPITIPATCTVGEASRLMTHLALRHLLVVDDQGLMIGIISDRDLRGPLARGHASQAPDPAARVQAVMTRAPQSVGPTAELATIAHLMSDHTLSAMPVLGDDRRPIGVISYVDILRRLANDSDDTEATMDLMERDEIVVHPRT